MAEAAQRNRQAIAFKGAKTLLTLPFGMKGNIEFRHIFDYRNFGVRGGMLCIREANCSNIGKTITPAI